MYCRNDTWERDGPDMGWDRQRQDAPPLRGPRRWGTELLSRRVANDEPELLQLLAEVLALGDEVTWAVDMADGGAALLIALLVNHEQELLYIPGRAVNRATDGYRGEGRTDACDALVISSRCRSRSRVGAPAGLSGCYGKEDVTTTWPTARLAQGGTATPELRSGGQVGGQRGESVSVAGRRGRCGPARGTRRPGRA